MGRYRFCHCHTHCVLCHESMAAKLCLSHQTELVDFCVGGFAGAGNCVADGELAEMDGGEEESGGGVEV